MKEKLKAVDGKAPRGESAPSHRFPNCVVGAMVVLFLSSSASAAYPPAGSDQFYSAAIVTIELEPPFVPFPVVLSNVTVAGPVRVQRGTPFDPGDGRIKIETEIVALDLRGSTPVGPITIRESPSLQSPGAIQQQTPGVDFPADSFFDVFVELDTPLGTLHNNNPIKLVLVIHAIPPLQETYEPELGFPGVVLFNAAEDNVGLLRHANHHVGQTPSFSVAPEGPSMFDPADILGVPAAPEIDKSALGLVEDDDIDALSYGVDFIDETMPIAFSVDPASVGAPGSAVALEAAKLPPEAHGDEFLGDGGGSNVQVLDEDGDTGVPAFTLLVSDDVDALTEHPTSFVDPDGDGLLDSPVYFSLSPDSPTLGLIGAGPADVLRTTGGTPVIFKLGASLELDPDDDIDALCLEASADVVLYSLAPDSPTLGSIGAGPADILRTTGGSSEIFRSAASMGLDPEDNLNASKCLPPPARCEDDDPPICVGTPISQDLIEVEAGDDDSGLARIDPIEVVNATVICPAFDLCTQQPVICELSRNGPGFARVELEVVDCCGNKVRCDPVLTLVIRERGKPVSETLTDLPQAESNITCYNGDPGLKNLVIDVNGTRFRLAGLWDDETATLDVSSAMVEGDNNTITLTAFGKPGTSALVVISD